MGEEVPVSGGWRTGLLGSVIVVRVVVRELVGRIVPCGAVPAQRCMVQILAGVITRCRGEVIREYILLSTGGARGDSMTARSRGTPKGSVHSHSSGGKCQRENV